MVFDCFLPFHSFCIDFVVVGDSLYMSRGWVVSRVFCSSYRSLSPFCSFVSLGVIGFRNWLRTLDVVCVVRLSSQLSLFSGSFFF